jgi:hypothetical protein
MVRPLRGLQELMPRMAEQLAVLGDGDDQP